MTQVSLAIRLSGHRQKDLRTMAAYLGLRQSQQRYDLLWCEHLARGWQEPLQRRQWLALLSPRAHAALLRLLASKGLPATLFFAEYGPLRSTTARQRTPNPSEELFYAGLLHPATPGTIRKTSYLVTAYELQEVFKDELVASRPVSASEQMAPDKPTLLLDLAQWLFYLYQQPCGTLQQGRWLLAAKVAELNQRLVAPVPSADVNTHAQTPALARLAWWGTAAGLADANGLTAAAWAWLADSPTEQIRTLWQNWLAADSELRRLFHQPQTPPHLWAKLLAAALELFASPFRASDVTHALLAHGTVELGDALEPFVCAYFANLTELDRQVYQSLEELCELGMLLKINAGPIFLAQNETIAATNPVQSVEASADDFLQSAYFVLTPLGQWLLSPSNHRPPEWAWESSGIMLLQAEADSVLWLLQLPAILAPSQAIQIAAFGDYLERRCAVQDPYLATYLYALTPQTVARAAANGHKLANLLWSLTPLRLTPRQTVCLQSWYAQAGELEIGLYPLLRATSTSALIEVAQNPTLRSFLGEWLSPSVVSWTGEAEPFVHRLQQAGYRVNRHFPSQCERPVLQNETEGTAPTISQIEALWLAGQFYSSLGDHLSLPMPIDHRHLQMLFDQLPMQQQAALLPLWQRLRHDFLNLLDHLPFMPPSEPTDPATWHPVIKEAINEGRELEILYFSAGRNLLTQRWVQPYHLFEQHSIPYLRGYCHAIGSVLTFRLDRVQSILAQREGSTPPDA